jgi:hypothetical protein
VQNSISTRGLPPIRVSSWGVDGWGQAGSSQGP